MYVILETSSAGSGVATLTVYDDQASAQRVRDRWQAEADENGVPVAFAVHALRKIGD